MGGVSADKIPAVIQTVSSKQLQEAQSLSLAEYMNRYLGGVNINDTQSNPLQPDVYYRGFAASPVLGLPQGLSTYVNGVRFNEPFSDLVNWDLLSKGAIASMELIPGSNPVYGLNSLGGAISVKTKTGFTAPKHELEVYGGSWNRQSEELSSGGNNGTFGYFLDVHNFSENGWRNYSPSDAKQVLGTLSWQNHKGSLDLTVAANDNNLSGNGALPVGLQAQNPRSVFTQPAQTITRLFFSELAGTYDLSNAIEVSGNVYFRQNRIKYSSVDGSPYGACDASDLSLLCNSNGNIVIDSHYNPVQASPNVDGATITSSAAYLRSRGGTLQSVFRQDLFKHGNTLTAGTSYDYSLAHTSSDTELSSLTLDRGSNPTGIYDDQYQVRLNTVIETIGVYLTDSFSVTDKLTATVAGRYNNQNLKLENQTVPYGGTDNLSGKHQFERFNPSFGLTYQLRDNLGTYGSYSESTRAPTPMELSCADPLNPCRIPNAFISDPPLKQVVAKTWESGFRGHFNKLLWTKWDWNLGYFHTINNNDIIFQHDGSINGQGYFNNVGKTRRYGLEAASTTSFHSLFSPIDDWHFSANYTYLNARFLDQFGIINPLDPNHQQIIPVNPGSRIPGIPEHIFKAAIAVDLWRKLSLGFNGLYSGSVYLKGDEANTSAKLSGYWLFNATAEYKVTQHFSFFGKLDNVFNNNYNTSGYYGNADLALGAGHETDRFVSPGAPRAGWIGIRLTL